jgi:hypothetical protein
MLVVNIFFYGIFNILIFAIFDWLNKIFAKFFFQTVIFATLTIILILNQSTLLVNNQFNSTKEAIKSTDESIETINEFLGGLNLNTFPPIRSLVKFSLDFYSLLYTTIHREILDVCSKIAMIAYNGTHTDDTDRYE